MICCIIRQTMIAAVCLAIPIAASNADDIMAPYPVKKYPVIRTQSDVGVQLHSLENYGARAYPANYNLFLQDDAPSNDAGDGPAAESSPGSSEESSPSRRQRRSRTRSGRSLEVGGPFISTRSFFVSNDLFNLEGIAEFPILGRMNVGEHNSPFPRNRSYAIYKHYDNVLTNKVNDYSSYPIAQSDRAIDQYLLGFEKTFHNERSSIELRMPLLNSGNSGFDAGFASDDASIGNLGIIGKRLLNYDSCNPISCGCGVTVPTGDSTLFSIGDQTFDFQNDSVHLIPFLATIRQNSSQRTYFISFASLDIPLVGNRVEFNAPSSGSMDLGRLDDQMLVYVDVALGHWLHRDLSSDFLIGLAVQAELHYAGTLESADSLSGVIPGPGWTTRFDFGNSRGQFDNTIAAIMMHAELRNNLNLRVSGLFPLTDEDDRFFDSEVIVALQRRF